MKYENKNILDIYIKESLKYKILALDEEKNLAILGTKEAKQALINSNLRFVVKLAHKYHKMYKIDLFDLIQEGNLGLIKAVNNYKPEKNVKVVTYALWWIEVFLDDYILKNWSLVKIDWSSKQRLLFFPIQAARIKLEKLLNTEVTDADLAEYFSCKESEIKKILIRLNVRDISLSNIKQKNSTNYESDLALELQDFNQEPLDIAYSKKEQQEKLYSIIERHKKAFSDRELFIIYKHFLMDDDRCNTIKKIGEHLHISKERARQIKARLLIKLQKIFSLYKQDFFTAE